MNERSTSPPAPPSTSAPLTTREPWAMAGVSRAGWYRLMKAGQAPAPLRLPGVLPVWRIADVEAWVAALPTGRRPRAAREGGAA